MRRPTPHPRSSLLRGVGRLERHSFALGLAVAGVAALIGLFAWASTGGVSFGGRYPFTVVLPGSTPPLANGAQVRVAGKIAGAVSGTQPGPNTLTVNAYLNHGFGPLGRGAHLHVGVLLGTTLVYLVVYPGDPHHPLPPGSVIPERRVTLSSSLPQALEAFNAATRRALARNLAVIGGGWVGQGAATNRAIADQALDYQQGTPLLQALSPAPGVLGDAVVASARVAEGLTGERPDDIAALTAASASFWETLATHDRAARLVAQFPAAERVLTATYPRTEAFLGSATHAVQRFAPLARAIARLDPSFESLFASGPTLVDATARFNTHAPSVLRRLTTTVPLLLAPARSLPTLVPFGHTVSAAIQAYGGDINTLAADLTAVTSYSYGGQTALRLTGTIGCVGGRDPYPKPGQAEQEAKAC